MLEVSARFRNSGNVSISHILRPLSNTFMSQRGPVSRGIAKAARDRVERYLRRKIRHGERVVSLSELAEETAIDPTTVEAVMDELTRPEHNICRRVE